MAASDQQPFTAIMVIAAFSAFPCFPRAPLKGLTAPFWGVTNAEN